MTTAISHHISDDLLIAYAAGSLDAAFSLVVAAHVSMCDSCRARLEAHQVMGGIVLESSSQIALRAGLRDRVMAALDEEEAAATGRAPPAAPGASGVFPAPVMDALGGKPPRWKMLGGGVRQTILWHSRSGSVRLLYIPAGQGVPDHSHGGLEMTLVLQGAFRDSTGRYGVGDVEIADSDLEHEPHAEEGAACICLAATDAALRFRSFVPRLLQPIFRI